MMARTSTVFNFLYASGPGSTRAAEGLDLAMGPPPHPSRARKPQGHADSRQPTADSRQPTLRPWPVASLRVGVAERTDEADRAWTGFSTQLTPGQLQAALSGWWRCDPERVVRAGLMAVTLGQYVVAVLTGIDGYDGRGDGRYRFHGTLAGSVTELVTPQQWVNPDAPGADRARLLLGRRLESESGGPVAYVRPGG